MTRINLCPAADLADQLLRAGGWDGASGLGFAAGVLLLAASEELRSVSPHPGARGTTDEA